MDIILATLIFVIIVIILACGILSPNMYNKND